MTQTHDPWVVGSFNLAKRDLIACTAEGLEITQMGPHLLDHGPIPWPSPSEASLVDADIETFEVSSSGGLTSTSFDSGPGNRWIPAATVVVDAVMGFASDEGITFEGTPYLTASQTPLGLTSGLPHFDDDLVVPRAGVGLVAIVGDIAGPRVASEPITLDGDYTTAQLTLGQDLLDRFAAGEIRGTEVAPNQIVAFAQFAQLHSGPTIQQAVGMAGTKVRNLLVFRVRTKPVPSPRYDKPINATG